MVLIGYSGAGGKLTHEKTRSKKSRDTAPFNIHNWRNCLIIRRQIVELKKKETASTGCDNKLMSGLNKRGLSVHLHPTWIGAAVCVHSLCAFVARTSGQNTADFSGTPEGNLRPA